VSIDVKVLGIVTDVRELQPLNALEPINVTLLGNVTDVREVQDWNAKVPIDVTPLGIAKLENALQFRNA